jgi:hypothetical protein
VCAKCARTVTPGRELPGDARAAIVAWLSNDHAQILDEPSRRAHLRLLREFLHHHMADGRSLRALDGWEARLRKPA